jgi:DNA-binding NtrC family response regulator
MAFGSFGRVFFCLDREFRILHASYVLDELLGEGAAERAVGRPLDEFLGGGIFSAGGSVRAALEAGERREGWRALLRGEAAEPILVALSAAPMHPPAEIQCDPRVAFAVIARLAEEDVGSTQGSPETLGSLIGRSEAMRRLFTLIRQLSESEATVLLCGEEGVGKEALARAIHEHSPRRTGPFVGVHCADLPEELLASELWGHAEGAVAGAARERLGRFEIVSDGTLFLDDVDRLAPDLQEKLLRVLQEGVFTRRGETRLRPTRARVIAATRTELAESVRAGAFREDLWRRLRSVPIDMPPLRERTEDVEPVARAILARTAARWGKSLRITPETLRDLLEHDWPGNVRELEAAIEYAVAVCHGPAVQPKDLPALVRRAALPPAAPTPEPVAVEGVGEARRRAEALELRRALEKTQWNRSEAARTLGISRTTLWRKMRDFGMVARWRGYAVR